LVASKSSGWRNSSAFRPTSGVFDNNMAGQTIKNRMMKKGL